MLILYLYLRLRNAGKMEKIMGIKIHFGERLRENISRKF